jgi:hypothetical protein
MRTVHFLAAVLFAAAILAPITAGTAASSSTDPSTQSRKAQCDAERKACYAGKTQTGSFGATYVAPEDVRICEEGYRMCTGEQH